MGVFIKMDELPTPVGKMELVDENPEMLGFTFRAHPLNTSQSSCSHALCLRM